MKNKRILMIAGSIAAVIVIVLTVVLININKDKTTYEVAFIIDGDASVETQTINKGEKAIKPADPEKEGYVFIGWTYENEIYDFSKEVTFNLELKAMWEEIPEEVETFTVKFDSDGGTTIANQVVEKGKKVEKPEEPIKEGYVFKGWTLNGEEYNWDTEITEDLNLIANWEKINNNQNESNNNKNQGQNNSSNNSNNKEEKNENDNITVKAPTLSVPMGGMSNGIVYANLNIISEGEYAYGTENISGYELYEKNGSNYTLVHTSETKFGTDVTVDAGESKTYVARVYVYNKSNVKIYSNYSNEEKIDNSRPETPVLTNAAGGERNGVIYANLNIISEGEYAYGTENISGYELYEKNGSNYTLVHTSETKFGTDVTVDAGESKTYVARVYVYNKSNVKIYSNYSNEVVIR